MDSVMMILSPLRGWRLADRVTHGLRRGLRSCAPTGLLCALIVLAASAQADVSFRNDVQPILTRAGCNSGACHGAAAGKNGFKLSLRGYDDEGDYRTLTRQVLGRRINPADPGHSLMLLKPTTALPHKGGQRFKVDSPEYRVLSEWIA